MTVGEIQARLAAAMPLRIPMFNPSDPPQAKVSALEDYLRTTAYHRAELEEALHWGWEARKLLERQWTDVDGWQAMAGSKATGPQIDSAKRVCAPDVWAGIQDVKILLASLERQIKRLEKDGDAASRSYTMLT